MEPQEAPGDPPDPAASDGISRYVPRDINAARRASFFEGNEGDIHEYEVQSPETDFHGWDFDSEESSYQQPKIMIGSNFITTRRNSVEISSGNRCTLRVYQILRHPVIRNGMGLLTLLDAVLNCVDIDARAAGGPTPVWVIVVSNLCLASYTIEYLAWASILPTCRLLRDRFLLTDLIIIIVGYVELLFLAIGFSGANLGWLRVMRVVRILRLLKVFRKVPYLKELQKLVNMTSTCMKTLGWSFIFCFVIMTIWAMLMVEFVHPLILELNESQGVFEDDLQVLRSASSVMEANLLLFKTVIAGDSWGMLAVPLIQAHPATGIIFVGSLLTIIFGVLQLVVAVVVDTFAEKRERDVLNRAEEMENDIEEDRKFLRRIFDRVDEDGSGELTLEELIEGAKNDPEFQSRLRVMDIDEADLSQLFLMIDVKGTGQVSPEEFIQPLSRWVHESKTANRFVKYNVMRSMHQTEELRAFTSAKFEVLGNQIQRIATSLGISVDSGQTLPRRNSRKKKGEGQEGQNKKPQRQQSFNRLVSDVSHSGTSSAKITRSRSDASLSLDGKEFKSIADRLTQMETQQRLILDNLSYAQPPEANRFPRNGQMPWDSMQLGMMDNPNLSQSLSTFSNASGGLPGGTVARPGSEASPPRSSNNYTQDKDVSIVPVPATILSQKNLIILEDQLQETEGIEGRISDRELDAALQGTMEVMEDLLQSAASQACVKAAATLRLRLQSLLSPQGEETPSELPVANESNDSNANAMEAPDSGSAPGARLANVKQKWFAEVRDRSALRPKAPQHPRLLRLGEEERPNASDGTQL